MLRLLTTAGLLLVVGALRADDQAAVTIESVEWGFDGKAQERTFTPLSVLVQNNTALEFEGTLTLTKLVQTTKPIDASIVREVYVGPFSSRWVQFVPYVVSDWEQWRLEWGHAEDEHFDIPSPQVGEAATVLLYDPDGLQRAGGVLRRFPVNLFPASVTGTDGLRGVAMDEAPRWQGARRQAFLDWLKLGGRVFLLRDEQGRFPTFPESLSELNGRGDRFSVGAGTVERIGQTVAGLEPDFVKARILSDPHPGISREELERYRRQQQVPGFGPMLNRTGWDRDTQMFLDLQTITRFARRWWAVYILSLLYLLALFPVCYRVGKEAKDYRWMYAVLLASVGLFSVGFASLSRLGASEVSRARTVAVARQLDEGLYDVTGWTCVGVRSAGRYTVTHEGTGRLYSTSQDIERIDGSILAGADAEMVLDIPPASTRTVLYRSRSEGPPLGLSLQQVTPDEHGLGVLSIGVGPEFPDEPMMIMAAFGSRLYEMRRSGNQLLLASSSRKPIVSYLTDYGLTMPQTGLTWGLGIKKPDPPEDTEADEVYRLAVRTLVGNSFGLGSTIEPEKLKLNNDVVRIFVYARQPDRLKVSGESFLDQSGYVMYCADLPIR